ncbi:unnamed protein product [Rotaria socialis]|uniref:Cation efflux protein transmembrane domain-containing protein n=1 Tax=Rotaria socialis TaxID=392032 RepID=A0A821DSZ0_9BILA|nr:unnamed protein product [Rotaria socialis]CAF4626286.1 unnamed protein product [Rotaria socialis]
MNETSLIFFLHHREPPKEQSGTLGWWKVKLRTVLYIHLVFTMILLILKVVATIWSSSMSIRSLVGDSAVDLINLSLLLGASFIAKRNKNKYPLGRENIETLAILTMAVIMTGMLGGVIIQAGLRLWAKYQYFFSHGEVPEKANITVASASIVGALILIKLILLVVCVFNKSAHSKALKKDHQSDILMNLGALGFGYLGSFGTHGNWTEKLIIIDDIGAICLASYGIYAWLPQIQENVRRACHRIVEDDDVKAEIRGIADGILKRITAENEEVYLGDTIVCHGGADKLIIMQMITLPDSIEHQRVKEIFSQLKIALIKNENTGHVFVHWEL